MKGNVIIALIVGAALGFLLGKVTSTKQRGQQVAQQAPAQPTAPTPTPAAPPPARPTEDPNAIYKVPVGNSPVTGPATAKVTIVEITDFECPFCSRANDTMKQLLKDYPKDVRIVAKMNPLPFHKNANPAAQAALAAHEQGKYWEMHNKLFDNAKALERSDLEKYAQELGLNMAKFKEALDKQKFNDTINADQALARSLGATGTPAFFINGKKLSGARPIEQFKDAIEAGIKRADELLASGTKANALYDALIKDGATSQVNLPGAAPTPAAPEQPVVKKVEAAAWSPTHGPKDAKVTIIEWSDFQCPFCSRGAKTAHEIMKAYPKDVKFVFRHQPLGFHDRATPAAKASMAAHKQGKFWEMHDKLFENQRELTDENFEKWAKELGLNMNKFKADMASPEIAEQVKKDSEAGSAVGADGTPAFFINGKSLVGAQPFEKFKEMIDAELK